VIFYLPHEDDVIVGIIRACARFWMSALFASDAARRRFGRNRRVSRKNFAMAEKQLNATVRAAAYQKGLVRSIARRRV